MVKIVRDKKEGLDTAHKIAYEYSIKNNYDFLISLDSDIMLMGLVTDSHQHAYVLQSNEEDVPDDLKKALKTVNQMQDLFAAEFRLGRTGKEIVASSKKIELLPSVIESELGFHPPPMFIRRFLLGGYMFSHKTYVAGMTSGPGYYPTSIVTNNIFNCLSLCFIIICCFSNLDFCFLQ